MKGVEIETLPQKEINEYLSGMSLREVALTSKFSASGIRTKLEESGLMRSRAEGSKLAIKKKSSLRSLPQKEINEYLSGMSVREVALTSVFSHSAIRKKLEEAGLIRSKADATRLALERGSPLISHSRLTEKENGLNYAAGLSQLWIRKTLGVKEDGATRRKQGNFSRERRQRTRGSLYAKRERSGEHINSYERNMERQRQRRAAGKD